MTLEDFIILRFVFLEQYRGKYVDECEKDVKFYLFKKYKKVCKVTIELGGVGDFYGTFFTVKTDNNYINNLLKKVGRIVCKLEKM